MVVGIIVQNRSARKYSTGGAKVPPEILPGPPPPSFALCGVTASTTFMRSLHSCPVVVVFT